MLIYVSNQCLLIRANDYANNDITVKSGRSFDQTGHTNNYGAFYHIYGLKKGNNFDFSAILAK